MSVFRALSLLSFTFLCISCSSIQFWPFGGKSKVAPKYAKQKSSYNKAVKSKEEGEYEEALEKFYKLDTQFPNSIFSPSIKFQIAEILRLQNQCERALPYYKSAMSLWQHGNLKDTVRARYQMSFCYEALGSDDRSVAILLQYKNSNFLSREIRKVEIPARLATSYARLNNNVEARSFYLEAERGLKQLLRSQGKEISSSWLAQTLFQVGRVAIQDSKDRTYDAELRALVIGQAYIYRSIELGDKRWSSLAQKELVAKYKTLFEKLESMSLEKRENIIERRQHQLLQINRAMDMRVAIHKLKLEEIPLAQRNQLQTDLYKNLADLDHSLDRIIFQKLSGADVIKRQTEVNFLKYPETVFINTERTQERKSQLPRKLPVRSEEKAVESTIPEKSVEVPLQKSEDPNL